MSIEAGFTLLLLQYARVILLSLSQVELKEFTIGTSCLNLLTHLLVICSKSTLLLCRLWNKSILVCVTSGTGGSVSSNASPSHRRQSACIDRMWDFFSDDLTSFLKCGPEFLIVDLMNMFSLSPRPCVIHAPLSGAPLLVLPYPTGP